jgi:hypothetical protein
LRGGGGGKLIQSRTPLYIPTPTPIVTPTAAPMKDPPSKMGRYVCIPSKVLLEKAKKQRSIAAKIFLQQRRAARDEKRAVKDTAGSYRKISTLTQHNRRRPHSATATLTSPSSTTRMRSRQQTKFALNVAVPSRGKVISGGSAFEGWSVMGDSEYGSMLPAARLSQTSQANLSVIVSRLVSY